MGNPINSHEQVEELEGRRDRHPPTPHSAFFIRGNPSVQPTKEVGRSLSPTYMCVHLYNILSMTSTFGHRNIKRKAVYDPFSSRPLPAEA